MITFGFLKRMEEEDIKSIEDLLAISNDLNLKNTINMMKYHIIEDLGRSDYGRLGKFESFLSHNEIEFCKDTSELTDIRNVEIADIDIDDNEICTGLVFYDQNSRLRCAEVWYGPYIPGMAIYYQESSKIKNDLQEMLNQHYKGLREAQNDDTNDSGDILKQKSS